MMKVVLYDGREDSPTHGEINEFFMGERNQILLVIPPMVMHGMKAIGEDTAYVVNCPTEPYDHSDPDEFRVHPHEGGIPYDWSIQEG
jgi:dTDP-4-dehydrorhamnose 3,5-epimerase